VFIFFCLLDLALSFEDISWTKLVFNGLFWHVVWSIIARLSKEYEPAWLASAILERLCSDKVGITLLGFIPVYLKSHNIINKKHQNTNLINKKY
jgi:hypothetical protein